MCALLRRLLFRLSAEQAHRLGMAVLRLLGAFAGRRPPLPAGQGPDLLGDQRRAPLRPPHPASPPGSTRTPEAVAGFFALGFAGVEVGTVTPFRTAGQSRPRLFRLPQARALINRMGFNNAGAAAMAEPSRLAPGRGPARWASTWGRTRTPRSTRAVDDYLKPG